MKFSVKFSDVKQSKSFILLINVQMPSIVGILTFMSRVNFLLRRVEHEKSHSVQDKFSHDKAEMNKALSDKYENVLHHNLSSASYEPHHTVSAYYFKHYANISLPMQSYQYTI